MSNIFPLICIGKWKYIQLDNKEYAISARNENNVWKIFLTNFIGIWKEELQTETIIKRCKSLNPLLKIEGLNVDKIMEEILTNIPTYAEKKWENSITLYKNIQGGKFKFEIVLEKGSDVEFFEVVMKPIGLSSIELFRRYSVLSKLLKRKDEEIAEYKAEGAQLIRKNIETKPFTEDLFKPKQTNTEDNGMPIFQSLVDLCNKAEDFVCNIAEKLNLRIKPILFENSNRLNESKDVNVQVNESSNDVCQSSEITIARSSSKLPIDNESRDELKRKQEQKSVKAKKAKGAISASFTKPIKKAKSRVTNFIS